MKTKLIISAAVAINIAFSCCGWTAIAAESSHYPYQPRVEFDNYNNDSDFSEYNVILNCTKGENGTYGYASVPCQKNEHNGATVITLMDKSKKIVPIEYDYNYSNYRPFAAYVPKGDTVFYAYDDTSLLTNYIALYYQVEKAYDFYNSLGWKSFDGNGSPVYVQINDSDRSISANSMFDVITIGLGEDINRGFRARSAASSTDVIGHEFTHLVAMNKLGWDGDMPLETRALMEAYCDIMGELCSDNLDWKIGTDLYTSSNFYSPDRNNYYSLRDIADPGNTKTPLGDGTGNIISNSVNGIKCDKLYTDYDEFKTNIIDRNYYTSKRNSAAVGSTVISHTAYVMYKNGITRNDLAKLWFYSMATMKDMHGDTRKATFSDCREALIAATDIFNSYLSYKYKGIINNAFDEAHIYLNGDYNKDGVVDINDIKGSNTSYAKNILFTSMTGNKTSRTDLMNNFIDNEKREMKNFSGQRFRGNIDIDNCYWNSGLKYNTVDPLMITADDCCENNKRCNYVTIGNTFYRGFDYSFDIANEEPYYQCAGFAKKLQNDYFGTTKTLQLTDMSEYKMQLGDHLRGQQYSRGRITQNCHSFFITGINTGNRTFTYADCNASGDCKINWEATGSYLTDSYGNITQIISENGEQYNPVWVERPIMVGDTNGDGVINGADKTELSNVMNKTARISQINTKYRDLACDVNMDGVISQSDLDNLDIMLYNPNGSNVAFLK